MPSPQSDALARSFRAAQISTSLISAALVRDAWKATMDPKDIQGSAQKWLALATIIIIRYRQKSAAQAATYYATMRALELPDAPKFNPPAPKLLDAKFLRSSLWAIGPEVALRAKEQVAPDAENPTLEIMTVLKNLGDAVEATTIRHTQNGGRAAIDQARELDPVAVGYYRETDGDPCYFCSILASRLGVYKEDSFDESDARFEGEGKAKVHDSCACHNRPLFVRQDDSKFPQSNRDAAELWKAMPTTWKGEPTTGPGSFRAAMNAYRFVFNEAKRNNS